MVESWRSHEGEPLIWSKLPMSEKNLTKKAIASPSAGFGSYVGRYAEQAKIKYPQDFEMI